MSDTYDVFLSHAWADGDTPGRIAASLEAKGLHVFFDGTKVDDFDSITRNVDRGLARSKALVAFYTKNYPLRRACQWELTAAFLAAQSEGDARKRVLVLNPEKGSQHIHPVELRDGKYLQTKAEDEAAIARAVDAIVTYVNRLNGLFEDIRPLHAPRWYGYQPVGSTRFVGRLEKLWEIHTLLHRAEVAQVTGSSAATGHSGQISGMGGVGKSLLAEEYALRFGAAYPGGIFWLKALGNDDAKGALGQEAREAERLGQLRRFADVLDPAGCGSSADPDHRIAAWIGQGNKPCLWIVDDLPNGMRAGDIQPWLAPHPLARTLFTTRSREYVRMFPPLDLSVLQEDEAYELLTAGRTPADEKEKDAAKAIVRELGCHALAVDVTGPVIDAAPAYPPFAWFLKRLVSTEKDALTLTLAKELEFALPNGHERSIAKTLLQSIDQLGSQGHDLLRLASVLAVAPLAPALVTEVFAQADGLSAEDAEDAALRAFADVTRASLAEKSDETGGRTIHTLVSRTVRFHDRAQPKRTAQLRTAALQVIAGIFRKESERGTLIHLGRSVLPHARQLFATVRTEDEANLALWVAYFDWQSGAYQSARVLEDAALEARKELLGAEHPDTLTAMNNLAETVRAMGDSQAARKLQETVLEARQRLLGAEHRDTLTAMNNLALTVQSMGDSQAARKLQETVLETRQRLLGPEHPDTLMVMNNLASTIGSMGDSQAARKLQETVLEARQRLLGPEHPSTLTAMSNLALSVGAMGDSPGARELLETVLEAWQRLLGPEHPDTLTAMSNLAETVRAMGDSQAARKLQEIVLEARKRLLGPEHPDTLTTMNNLALTVRSMGDSPGARELQETVLEARQRSLGREHPDTLMSMNNLAVTLDDLGDLQAERELQETVLEAQERLLGAHHPSSTIAAWNLYRTLKDLGESSAATALLNGHLRWLQSHDPATLAVNQRNIRGYVLSIPEG